ncbi:MAG: hypothetical protein LBV55_04360 [Acholeplasmatales bacterium]|jgi:hypothetical protein|nr:hypothetical protein [Acholeplasmatales bacterium]
MEKYTQDKMYDYFIKYIDKVSNEEIDKLNKELNDLKQNALSVLTNQLNSEYSALYKREEEKSSLILVNEKRLISNSYNIKFQENLNQYFLLIREKLLVYLRTYLKSENYLYSIIPVVNKCSQMSDDFIFEISEEDALLKVYLVNNNLKFITSKILGGFIASSPKGILVDESFDEKMSLVNGILYKMIAQEIYHNE